LELYTRKLEYYTRIIAKHNGMAPIKEYIFVVKLISLICLPTEVHKNRLLLVL